MISPQGQDPLLDFYKGTYTCMCLSLLALWVAIRLWRTALGNKEYTSISIQGAGAPSSLDLTRRGVFWRLSNQLNPGINSTKQEYVPLANNRILYSPGSDIK